MYNNIGHETNLLLSQNLKLTYNTWKTHLGCMNVLVIGATGEGKSRNLVRPISYSGLRDPKTGCEMSFVFTDPKGELYQDTAGFFEANGYSIKVLNLIDMLHSDCYNCFKYFNYSKNPDITLMNYINSLVEASAKDDKEPYWYNMAKNVLNCIAYYVYYELSAKYQNLTTVSDMVPLFFKGDKDKEAPIDNLLRSTCKNVIYYNHPAVIWRKKTQKAQGKELTSIMGVTNDVLRLWADSNIRRLTQVDTIQLDQVGDRPTALYVITPPDNSTYDFIVGTFYDQLISTLMYKANFIYNKKGLPHHVILMQDEAANTGKINDYNKKIAVWRSVNMSSIQIVQSSNQFKAMYGDKAQDVIDNAHITIFLGNGGNGLDINGTSAAEFISRALGKTTIKSESYSLNYNNNEVRPNISSSINSNQRDLMTPDEVKRLKWDECIVMVKGYKPFIDKKIDLNTCLNYASELYSTKDDKGNWHLKKELVYDIEEKKQTLDEYFKGFEESKEIDRIQYTAVKKKLVIDSLFSSFEKKKNSMFIDNSIFYGIQEHIDYVNKNGKLFYSENLIKRVKEDSSVIGCFLRESTKAKNVEEINDTENIENDVEVIKNDDEEHLSLEEKKIVVKFIEDSEKALNKAKKGNTDAIKEQLSKIGI